MNPRVLFTHRKNENRNEVSKKFLWSYERVNNSAFALTEFSEHYLSLTTEKRNRVESIDFLRGLVMIIMALDHVRDYFHRDAFFYSPSDLTHTNAFLFFTRFITHYCAPVFVFLAGVSSYLYGVNKTKSELAYYLLTRGMWLVFVELFIISLGQTFNPSYSFFNLQVIWAIGISMMILAAMIFLRRKLILTIGLILIACHNFLDGIHVAGNSITAFAWSLLHEPKDFVIGNSIVSVHYPLLPWIGIIAIGYYFGSFYKTGFSSSRRMKILLSTGLSAVLIFFLLRNFNVYGDIAKWSVQKNPIFSVLSFLNVSKYPPSLLYILVTLGPALIFLALSEKPLNAFAPKLIVFGRVPFFYYVVHIYMIHILAVIGAIICGYHWQIMILNNRVNLVPQLKGYGFNLYTVYAVWLLLIALMYPLCKWFAGYKKRYQAARPWLRYL